MSPSGCILSTRKKDRMPLTPEDQASEKIDELLTAAGWHVCDVKDTNIHAARGVAIREFPLPGHGFAEVDRRLSLVRATETQVEAGGMSEGLFGQDDEG